jgi:hypothetical protein
METSLRSDLCEWSKAIIHNWIAIAGGAVVAVIFVIASIWVGGYWLRILSLVTLLGSLVCATFLAWRDEHRKTIGKEWRSILNKVVELTAGIGITTADPIVGLIKYSDEFGSEEGVEWVCRQLDEQGHGDPFAIIGGGAVFKPGFDGKRLKFLQDARVARISSMTKAIDYVHSTWASKNGLTRSDLAVQPDEENEDD